MRRHGAEKVGVFGSYARNEARSDSDFDLMVWFKDQKSLLGMIRIERELSELPGEHPATAGTRKQAATRIDTGTIKTSNLRIIVTNKR